MVEKIKLALERAYQERAGQPVLDASTPRLTDESVVENEALTKLAIDDEESLLSNAKYCLVNTSSFAEKRIISADGVNLNSEQYRLLRSKLLYLSKMEHMSTVGITSPSRGDGKTLTAANLAISLARSGETNVVLIDGDVNKPAMHHLLGVTSKYGLIDILNGQVNVREVILRLSLPNLWLIPGREENINLLDQSNSARVEQLVNGFSVGSQSIVIIDLPPVLENDESIVFASNMDAVIMVVQEGGTRSEEVTRACGLLQQCNLIGTVLNKLTRGT